MSVTTRNARMADIGAIDRVFRTSFCDTFAHLYRQEDLQAFLAKFTPEAWAEEMANPAYAFRLSEIDGRAVGYAKVGPFSLPIKPVDRSCELRQLYVLDPWHGSGVARELMGWALAEARHRGMRAIYLTVYTSNHRAMRFYQRFGFVAVGRYDFMVGKQADEDIIMRLMV